MLFRFELKKVVGKMRFPILICFALNLMGIESIAHRLDSGVGYSVLFSNYLPNLTFECAIIALLLTHQIMGYEYSSNTEGIVYSSKVGRKCLLYKLAATICAVFINAGVLYGASMVAFLLRGGRIVNNVFFVKVLLLSCGVILLFILTAFAVGIVIRNSWVAAAVSFGINTVWIGIVMSYYDISLLRLPLMGSLMSQKSWFTDLHGKHFELVGFVLSCAALIVLGTLTYKTFRRRDI